MFYAHSGSSLRSWEPLREHLRLVAERAERYAEPLGAVAEARLAGLLHDLGKYSHLFTLRLEGKARGLDHWSLGAWVALTRYRERGVAAALAVQGHHVGLQRADPDSLLDLDPENLTTRHPLGLTLTERDPTVLLERLEADGLWLPDVTRSLYEPSAPSLPAMLDVRMLFSALVDADFIETEAHFLGEGATRKYRQDGPELRAADALSVVLARAEALSLSETVARQVLDLRADVLKACLRAAEGEPGVYTLSAPTGSGKTLAMLALALRHAAKHGLCRVVVAIPFLTIIEQTARVYREILLERFGPYFVLEHHNLVDTGDQEPLPGIDRDAEAENRRLARQLAENWDAPVVITTNVQILESLFSNRPSACRKLHRLARSVILFDEVQTLPVNLAVPTLGALSHLSARYGSTVVFSTATQPAFDHLHERVSKAALTGWRPREVIEPSLRVFERARRVSIDWEIGSPRSWEEISDRLLDHGRALCIVNLKRHARDLAMRLRQKSAHGLFHISTNLCPAHRQVVLDEVRSRLARAAHEPCVLISTQCVEAGVDVDFPVVYRAFGPLDAIAQAAGRCNRNGAMEESGRVFVFLPEEERYPPGGYQQAAEVTRTLINEVGVERMDLQAPELFRRYYTRLYDLTKLTESARELDHAIQGRSFVDVARLYRVIAEDSINVVVPYDCEAYDALRNRLAEDRRLTRSWIRQARAHSISLFRPKPDAEVWNCLEPAPLGRGEPSRDWFIYLIEGHYDRDLLGLTAAEGVWIA
jgi:CRISPR-associated helicase Cas3/CRISPR-associated endonuclease Cas3-HD